jgi:hypothetical protein
MRTAFLAAAFAVAFATGPAGAAVMQAQITGDWNDNEFWKTWQIDITYDTALATETPFTDPNGGVGHALVWTSGGGTPSPILSLTGTLFGRQSYPFCFNCSIYPIANYQFSFDAPTAFQIDQTGHGILISAQQGALGFTVGSGSWFFAAPPVTPFDQPYHWTPNDYVFLPMAVGAPYQVTSPFTRDVNIRAVPEPGSWALMILGVLGMGAALRRHRRLAASPGLPT